MTDGPVDTLEYHIKIKEDEDFDVKVLPTFENGEASEDMELLENIIRGICYNNAKKYFRF